MKPKNIIVTGGAGFIGSHLVESLVNVGENVTVLDNFSRGSMTNLFKIAKKIRIVDVDLRDHAKSGKFFLGQDIAYNLAALNTGVDFDVGKTEYMFEENMLLQMNPLRAAAEAHVPIFIQMSTASIYSRRAMELRIPTKEQDDEEEPEPSKLGYAWAKKMGERLAVWYGQHSAMRTIVVRPINVYGERDHFDDRGHFLPCMVKKFLTATDRVEVFGSGKQKRSFLHVADLVKALTLLSKKGVTCEAYNVDANDEHSVEEIVLAIQKLIKPAMLIVFNRALPQGSQRRMLNSEKIRRLGWKPTHSLLASLPILIRDIEKRLKQ